KTALLRERNPELTDVAQGFTMYWINRDPKHAFAVGRLLPWVHLRHGDLPLGGTCRWENHIVPIGFSPRFRAFEPGFPRSSPYPASAKLQFAHMRHRDTLLTAHIVHCPKAGYPNPFPAILLGSSI